MDKQIKEQLLMFMGVIVGILLTVLLELWTGFPFFSDPKKGD
jgi:hypothetical protein